jgi:hypothetical protein
MQIMPDAMWIGRVPSRLANSSVGPVYLGLQRNKMLLPYTYSKRSMPRLVVVVLNYFGYDKFLRTMVTLWTKPFLLCDNESAIKIAYDPCEHSKTKHMDIQHHYLTDHSINGDIVISHVRINEQLIDIFTKPLDEKRFRELRSEQNIIDSWNVAWEVVQL